MSLQRIILQVLRKVASVNNQESNETNFASIKIIDNPNNLAELEADPGLRIPIGNYHVNDQVDMRSSIEFSGLKGIRRMVDLGRYKVYLLVYRLLTLSLILLVATAFVERVFSGMQFVKTKLSNRMGDQWLNDNLVIFIEREI